MEMLGVGIQGYNSVLSRHSSHSKKTKIDLQDQLSLNRSKVLQIAGSSIISAVLGDLH